MRISYIRDRINKRMDAILINHGKNAQTIKCNFHALLHLYLLKYEKIEVYSSKVSLSIIIY